MSTESCLVVGARGEGEVKGEETASFYLNIITDAR